MIASCSTFQGDPITEINFLEASRQSFSVAWLWSVEGIWSPETQDWNDAWNKMSKTYWKVKGLMRLHVHPPYWFVSLPEEPLSDRGLLVFLPGYLDCPPNPRSHPPNAKAKVFVLTFLISLSLSPNPHVPCISGDKGPLV